MSKLEKARSALVKAGMRAMAAPKYVRFLDLNEPLEPQIQELQEDLPDLFGITDETDDTDETDETDDVTVDKSLEVREATQARILGRTGPASRHVFKTERKPPAAPNVSEATKKTAEFLQRSDRPAPVVRTSEPRNLNGAPAKKREVSQTTQRTADRLRGK